MTPVPRADLLGAHISIAGGLEQALWRGQAVGCSTVQIFLKNQLQWKARPYTAQDIGRFTAAWRATAMRAVFAHSTYLRVRAFHLNDAKQPLGSGLDRHAKIGQGHLSVARRSVGF